MRTIIKSNYEELPRYVDVILGQRYKQDKNEFLQEESFRSVLLLCYLWFVTLQCYILVTYQSCPFGSGVRKFALDPVIVIFFKNFKNLACSHTFSLK